MTPVFNLKRVFKAPQSLVWACWTQQAHMQAWFTPPGSATKLIHFDCSPGGYTFYSMTTVANDEADHDCAQGEAGNVMYGKSQYHEVNPEDKIVYLNSFADAEGNPIAHPMAPGWPLFLHTRITFRTVEGGTEMDLTWVPYEATEAEAKTFGENLDGCRQGWTSSLDGLDTYLAGQS